MQEPPESAVVPEIDGKQFAFEAGRIYSMPANALVAAALLFLGESFVNGFGRSEVLVILASLVSLPVLFLYPLLTSRDGAPPSRGTLRMFVGLGAFIPYAIGCYLALYEGLWGLLQLLRGFSFSALFWSLACCVLGFVVVNGMYRLTELCRAVDEHRIIVRRSG